MKIIIYGLVISGIIILAAALIPVTSLIRQLAAGAVRRNWILLAVLICFFILGYFSYAATYRGIPREVGDFIVPAIFFLGAWFVLLVSLLSLQTAIDIKRISILEGEVISDPLMGIYNRRYLERRLIEEIARARRYNLPLATLLIDLDRFKTINDTYGHLIGDKVLSHLGKLITSIIRASDIAARYGGDEILVISPNTTAETAAKLAERLRLLLEKATIILPDGKPIHITASIGVSILHSKAGEMQALLKSADEALYHAKQKGRNRVFIHEPEAGEPYQPTAPAKGKSIASGPL